jgi:Fic-DOC domain mobile mystery protein B
MTERTLPQGATGGEDLSGLKKAHLSDRGHRNAAETEAIDRVYEKYIYRGRPKKSGSGWLTAQFIKKAHREMFGAIWKWAGKYRQSNLNIGIEWHQVPQQVELLCGDFQYWESQPGSMTVIEIAARLQNRLTRIHPFENGNGRHARLITDIYFHSRRMPLPRWPQIHRMEEEGDALRARYLKAMKSADKEDYQPLMHFFEECLKG